MTQLQVRTVFQRVLKHYPEVGPVNLDRLRVTDTIVIEAPDGEKSLSEAILNSCFPHADTGLEYVHYTSFRTLEKVVATGQWRLYWVIRRLDEAEYQTFCHDHGLDGYLDVDPRTNGRRFVDMCRDLFYTSFTRLPSRNETDMWHNFADQGRGVRLVFRIRPVLKRAELRPVRYQNQLLRTLIQKLQEACKIQLQRSLVLMGISRIGAFYLPMAFNIEDETRLLIKRFDMSDMSDLSQNPWAVVQNDDVHQYLPLPLNEDNEFCRIDLVRVDAGPRCSEEEMHRELRKNPRFAHLAPLLKVGDAMTNNEHEEARRRAYFFAIERGGGKLPPYHPDLATGDFCRAAGEVRAQRLVK